MADSMQQPFDPETSRLIKTKARKLSRKSGFTASDQDDIEQEFSLHLWLQMPKYDRSVGPWPTWASFILDKRGISLHRYKLAQQRTPKREECSLNEPVLDSDHRIVDRHQTTPEASVDLCRLLDLRKDISKLQSQLSDDALLLMRALVDDTIAAIARGQGWNRTTVSRHMRELRKACYDTDLREYL